MSEIKLSLFASAVRPHLWKELLDSLKGNKYPYEVIFSGFIDEELWEPYAKEYPEFKYIQTNDIKPAQCYEAARQACTGNLVCWCADDCRFSEGFVDKVVDWFTHLGEVLQKSYILSCRTNENNMNETMLNHRFFGRNQNTPIMSPLGVIRRDKLEEMGGFDKRYICGQYENDVAMRMWSEGGQIIIFNDVCITIDHKNSHGSETNFWSGYNEDREQLENSWVIGGYKEPPKQMLILPFKPGDPPPYWYFPINNTEVTLKRNDTFVPYDDKDLLIKSQEPAGKWK